MNRIPALDDGFLGCADGAIEGLDRLFATFRKEVPGRLKLEKRGLKALQKGVVQLARDARALVDAPFQLRVKFPRELMHTIAVQRPEQCEKGGHQ